MSDIVLRRVEKELRPIRIPLTLVDDVTGAESKGTGAITWLSTVNIYAEFFDVDSLSVAPVLQKQRVSGASSTGVTIEEDTGKSHIVIDFLVGDFAVYPAAGYNTAGKNERRFEVQVKYKDGTSDEQYLFPHRNRQGEWVRLYLIMERQLITA